MKSLYHLSLGRLEDMLVLIATDFSSLSVIIKCYFVDLDVLYPVDYYKYLLPRPVYFRLDKEGTDLKPLLLIIMKLFLVVYL